MCGILASACVTTGFFAIASAVDNAAAVSTMKPIRSDEERTAEQKSDFRT